MAWSRGAGSAGRRCGGGTAHGPDQQERLSDLCHRCAGASRRNNTAQRQLAVAERAMTPRALIIFGVAVLGMPVGAAAQSAPPPTSAGPMVIERIHSGFFAAPEAKVTEVDHKSSPLVGGSAGWVTDGAFFVGGGGYW